MKDQSCFNIVKPRLPKALDLAKLNDTMQDDDAYSECIIEKSTVTGEAHRLNMSRMVLRGVRFDAALPASEFEDVLFDGCDLSNVDFSDANLLRVAFINCRMTGVNFSGAILKDTELESSLVKYANFRFARFERAVFNLCDCSGSDFQEVTSPKVRFAQTNLRQAQMSGMHLADIDLTTCDIDGLGARPEDLRGAILSPDQAVTAAKIIGVVIRF